MPPENAAEMPPALELLAIHAGYPGLKPVVRDVSLTIGRGESVALLGPSGCGKSTLARVSALLHRPESGEVLLAGKPATGWRYRASRAQRTSVGLVFQQPRAAADPRLSLADLIAEPLRAAKVVARRDRDAIDRKVRPLAERVGLTPDLLTRRPHEVSDGQLQRACVARALVLGPSLLICDEMTAMLDASTTAALVAAVEEYRAESGAALLAVGHDRPLLARWCSRVHDYAALVA
ncbi:ABC transporter ATP-binding protein [Actinocorallia sp. A-T 12471]|uniref:ABC transporter ATP-binding protein n=1 Tax=Actinocorallia sp. A-T 12471 TaxID=3089813 RepID=UPI0029D2CDA5|nr:ATP-binding cassette domain-containing protein [Actinocorallia sp. A-T 12471]MDX6742685.1 ATP-binding cassette domain-containing protein [Actinocorallia sp. A-T 12471]